jgi:hypothetical protein
MKESDDNSATRPRVTIRRMVSDFGPSGGLLVASMGTTCCCCLHWIGAAIGGPAGLVAAWWVTTRSGSDIHPEARRRIFAWMWIGLVGTAVCLLVLTSLFLEWEGFVTALWVVLAFFPSLVFLPVGLSVFAGAWIAKRQIRARHEGEPPPRTGAFRLAWRVAWMAFVFSTLLTGVGYLTMLLLFSLSD